jgi:two-component system, NarL family, sensor kinase
VLAGLGQRLEATVAPQAVLPGVVETIGQALRLSYVAIELGHGDDLELVAVFGRMVGEPLVVPLVYQAEPIGRLLLGPRAPAEPFSPADRRLLADLAGPVAMAASAVQLTADLQRSRQRLVTALEEERRRLRRDLHDGLGPSLATLAMRLESAEELIASDPAQATAAVAGLADLARDEITEVRRLVDGLRPAALDQLGLVSALRQRAAQHDLSAGEGAVVWAIEAGDDVEPLPAAVEVAAYLISLEAVNNAVRHSAARACTVSLIREGGDLLVQVRDDGQGLADERPGGVGLVSMRERAEEVGGTCVVTSDETGTLVAARLPLGGEGA